MSGHNNIRKLLALAAAGALTTAEEKHVAEHVRSCIDCSNQLGAWQSIANELCQLPPPQAPSRLVESTLAQVQAKLAEQAEHDWNRRVMTAAVAFGWLLVVASWPVYHLVSREFGGLLGLQSGRTWVNFAAFTALAWLAGGVAAVILAVGQRRETRLA